MYHYSRNILIRGCVDTITRFFSDKSVAITSVLPFILDFGTDDEERFEDVPVGVEK